MFSEKYSHYKRDYLLLKQYGGKCEKSDKCHGYGIFYEDGQNKCCNDGECGKNCLYLPYVMPFFSDIECVRDSLNFVSGYKILNTFINDQGKYVNNIFIPESIELELSKIGTKDKVVSTTAKHISRERSSENVIFIYNKLIYEGSKSAVVRYYNQKYNISFAVKIGNVEQDVKIIEKLQKSEYRLLCVPSIVIERSYALDKKIRYIIMEHVSGNLTNMTEIFYKRKLKGEHDLVELYLILILLRVTYALYCLMANGLYYTDIKLENIFYRCIYNDNQYSGIQILIGDLGGMVSKDEKGVTLYPPFERKKDKGIIDKPTENDIVWGIGVLGLELLGLSNDNDFVMTFHYNNISKLEKTDFMNNVVKIFGVFKIGFQKVLPIIRKCLAIDERIAMADLLKELVNASKQ